MHPERIRQALRFYFISDEGAADPLDQVRCALMGGATLIQYRHKQFTTRDLPAVQAVAALCRANNVPLVVNDNILLAKAVGADGVHLGQDDENPALAREILGHQAIVGVSVSTLDELGRTDLVPCDYIGTGPVFATGTKADAKAVIGLSGLERVTALASIPVVAIGGIGIERARSCFAAGAAGVAVISAVSRAADRLAAANDLGKICGAAPRTALARPWQDEFGLIRKIVAAGTRGQNADALIEAPGDDTCLMKALSRPVLTTDCHRDGVHFRRDWQTLPEIGFKAVVATLSDLAAAYARPLVIFVNLTLPPDSAETDAVALYDGIGEALEHYRVALGGGNVSRGRDLAVDLFAVGEGRIDLFPTRRSARVGDLLCATGPLGLARAGLHCLAAGDGRFAGLIEAFKRPQARFDAAAVLAGSGVRCVMDISDGPAGDTCHIAEASGVSVELDMDRSCLAPALVGFCDHYGFDPVDFALAGGEDYELLFACPEKTFAALAPRLPGAVRVGRCLAQGETPLVGRASRLASYQHGSGEDRSPGLRSWLR